MRDAWAEPLDEELGELLGCVRELGAVVSFESIVGERRAEKVPHVPLVTPLQGTRHTRWRRDVAVDHREHPTGSAFSRPCLDCDPTARLRHPCDLAGHLGLIRREHQAARGYDDIEGANREGKILGVTFLPRDVAISFLGATLLGDDEEFWRQVDAGYHRAARPRHERGVPGSARDVEHALASTDTRASHNMVGYRLDAGSNPVVVARRPNCPVSLLELGEVWHSSPRFLASQRVMRAARSARRPDHGRASNLVGANLQQLKTAPL